MEGERERDQREGEVECSGQLFRLELCLYLLLYYFFGGEILRHDATRHSHDPIVRRQQLLCETVNLLDSEQLVLTEGVHGCHRRHKTQCSALSICLLP